MGHNSKRFGNNAYGCSDKGVALTKGGGGGSTHKASLPSTVATYSQGGHCRRGACGEYTGVVLQTVSANLEAMTSIWGAQKCS